MTDIVKIENTQEAIRQRREKMELALSSDPVIQARQVITAYSQDQQCHDSKALETILTQNMQDIVNRGDMRSLEVLLYGQALSLNAVYNSLLQRSVSPALSKPEHQNACIETALKVQKQALRVVEVLAMLKNPQAKTMIQQNMNAQQIQVNNGPASTEASGE